MTRGRERQMFRTAVAACVGLSFLLEPARASADERETATALEKFDDGRKLLESGNRAGALAAFEASNELLASPNSLLYMARWCRSSRKSRPCSRRRTASASSIAT